MKRTKEKLYDWIESIQARGVDISVNRRNNYYAIENKDHTRVYQAGLTLNETYIFCEGFMRGVFHERDKNANKLAGAVLVQKY